MHRSTLVAIPLSRPPIDDEIKGAILAAVDSGQYILGARCREFEDLFARYIGARHAVLTSSGTAALWLALRALGVKAGDEVLVPAHTAFPTVEAILAAGGAPVFVDVDDFYTLDAADAATKISPRAVGIAPVHLYGHPVDMSAVQELCARFGLWCLEDCCQAHGAAWDSKKVGSFGQVAVFSFYPSKNLPVMGDGGILVTDDTEIATRSRRLRDHGRRSKDEHVEVGFNLRFNEIQAAVGTVLLKRLDRMNGWRRALARRYAERLADLPVSPPREHTRAHHVYHLYVIRTPQRDALAKFLNDHGIQTGIHYPRPCHRQPAMRHLSPPSLARTEQIVQEILTLPLSACHTEAEIDEVATAAREFFGTCALNR